MPKYEVTERCFGFKKRLWEKGDIVTIEEDVKPPKFFKRLDLIIVPSDPIVSSELLEAADPKAPVVPEDKEPLKDVGQQPAENMIPLTPVVAQGKPSTGKAKGSTGKAKANK